MLESQPVLDKDYYISTVTITGLWGYRKVNLKLSPDVNFLIGGNGSGKTTIINLIYAVITANFEALAKLPFGEIRVIFRNRHSRGAKAINIQRTADANPNIAAELNISYFDNANRRKPDLVENVNYSFLRGRSRSQGGLMSVSSNPLNRRIDGISPDLINRLTSLCEVTWLSVHRKSDSNEEERPGGYDSSVDQRIGQISSRFNQYIAEIDNRIKQEAREFEKKLFASIIADPSQQNITKNALSDIHLARQKQYMTMVFKGLEINDEANTERLKKHYELASSVRDDYINGQDLSLKDSVTISSLFQAEQIIKFWFDYRKKSSEHSKGKETVTKMFAKYFKSKIPYIASDGRMYFIINQPNTVKDGERNEIKLITPFELSSGEKQLYIFLMEALLEKGRDVVYIADEPELSMHVIWQETLVSSLRSLNQNAQFIFATHSPDIVSSFSKNVIPLTEGAA